MHPEYTFESNYIDIDGHKLHYIDEGSGPVIVMVHGNPTWSFFFRKAIAHLSERFRVIALDHIGCGLSDKPQDYDYSLKKHINNLTVLIEQLKVKKCSLMVHDWGGAIGIGYAVKNPTTIEKIIIFNTAAFRSKLIPKRISVCRWPIIGEILVRAFNGFAWPATFMAVTKSLNNQDKKYYLMPYDSWRNRIAIYRFVQDIPLHSSHPSYDTLTEIEKRLPILKKYKIPMLILWGGKDFCFTQEFYKEWTSRFPEAKSIFFKEYGHYILEDGYKEIETYLDSFLK